MRHRRRGTIRQIARGIYDYPAEHPTFGRLGPTTESVVAALEERDAIRLQPSGGFAANVLGLSEQIPVRAVFLTDGASRRIKLSGGREIVLKRTTPRNMKTANRLSGTVIQALRYLGKDHVDDAVLRRLARRLTVEEREQLLKDVRFAPAWIASALSSLPDEPASR